MNVLGMRQIHLTVLCLRKVQTVKQNRPLLTHALEILAQMLQPGSNRIRAVQYLAKKKNERNTSEQQNPNNS
jgi:hypothetical protein